MSGHRSRSEVQLQALQKWRHCELEQAQGRHAEQQRITAEHERAVETVRTAIDESQNLVRSQTEGSRVISAEALLLAGRFAALQVEELRHATGKLEASQRELAAARAEVRSRFEQLSVVERLQERRAGQQRKDRLRKEQNRLDDQALLRSSRVVGRQTQSQQEI